MRALLFALVCGALLAVAAFPAEGAPTITLVSVDSAGVQGNACSGAPFCVEVLPPQPVPSDFVQISVAGELPDNCYSAFSSHSQAGTAIALTVAVLYTAPPGTVCTLIVEPFTVVEDIGALAAGIYQVDTTYFHPWCSPSPCTGSMTFDVVPDTDGDGVRDTSDNCPDTANPGQQNVVHPSTPAGDHCEDPEPDGVYDFTDNCPDTTNPGQQNAVHPGTPAGDHCEDPEPDGVYDFTDNCPDTANPGQENNVHPATFLGDRCEDPEPDGVYDFTDNCPDTANPGQENVDGDSAGDACDIGDYDGDSFADQTEYFCGSVSNDGSRVPERLDASYAGVDDDADTLVDEPLPPGAAAYDCDGDGYAGVAETHVFAGARDQDPCGTDAWPADLTAAGGFSTNKVNISDLAVYVGVPRYLNTNVGTNPGDVRLDVAPGHTFGSDINIADMQNIAFGTAPMLGGARMFNGPPCPWAP